MKVIKEIGAAPKFEFEASSPKDIFEKLALLDSLFTETTCGCCGSAEISYVNRPVENGSYLELRCRKCRAQLSYGQNKDGKGIFMKNWDSEAKCPLPNRGWYVYQKNTGSQSSSAPAVQAAPERTWEEPQRQGDIPF